jgi:hypothetical protein
MAAPVSGSAASPCINVCQMDGATGWCRGCLRTIDEIAAWGRLDEAGRRGVLAQLASRRAALPLDWQAAPCKPKVRR